MWFYRIQETFFTSVQINIPFWGLKFLYSSTTFTRPPSEKRMVDALLKPGSHIPPTYLSVTTDNWQRPTICCSRPRRICDGSLTYSNLRDYKSNCSNFINSVYKYGSNRVIWVLCFRCRSHKLFSSPTIANQQPLTCLRSWTQIMIRRWMFSYTVTVSQALPAAMSHVCRRHVRTRLNRSENNRKATILSLILFGHLIEMAVYKWPLNRGWGVFVIILTVISNVGTISMLLLLKFKKFIM